MQRKWLKLGKAHVGAGAFSYFFLGTIVCRYCHHSIGNVGDPGRLLTGFQRSCPIEGVPCRGSIRVSPQCPMGNVRYFFCASIRQGFQNILELVAADGPDKFGQRGAPRDLYFSIWFVMFAAFSELPLRDFLILESDISLPALKPIIT